MGLSTKRYAFFSSLAIIDGKIYYVKYDNILNELIGRFVSKKINLEGAGYQIGGIDKKEDANDEGYNTISKLKNHTFIVYPRIKFSEYGRYWLKAIDLTYNSYLAYRNIIENYAIPFLEV